MKMNKVMREIGNFIYYYEIILIVRTVLLFKLAFKTAIINIEIN